MNLISALIIYHSQSQRRWDSSLNWLSLAFNTACHQSHKTTPARLMFAFELNSPLSNLWSLNDLLPERVEAEELKKRWRAANINILRAHKRQADVYKGRRAAHVCVGDVVYIKNVWGHTKAGQGVTDKISLHFVEPYKVVRVLTLVSFLVELVRTHNARVKVGVRV